MFYDSVAKVVSIFKNETSRPLQELEKKTEQIINKNKKESKGMFKFNKIEILKTIAGVIGKKVKGGKVDGKFNIVKSFKQGLKRSVPMGGIAQSLVVADKLPELVTLSFKGVVLEIPTALIVAGVAQVWEMVSGFHKHRKIK